MIREKNAKILSEMTSGRVGANKGITITQEWRAKLRQSLAGHVRSRESIEKQRKTMTGRKRTQEEKICNIKRASRSGNRGTVAETYK